MRKIVIRGQFDNVWPKVCLQTKVFVPSIRTPHCQWYLCVDISKKPSKANSKRQCWGIFLIYDPRMSLLLLLLLSRRIKYRCAYSGHTLRRLNLNNLTLRYSILAWSSGNGRDCVFEILAVNNGRNRSFYSEGTRYYHNPDGLCHWNRPPGHWSSPMNASDLFETEKSVKKKGGVSPSVPETLSCISAGPAKAFVSWIIRGSLFLTIAEWIYT